MGNTVDINMLQVTPTESANSTKRTYLPAELYLPEWARDTEFFRNMCILLNYTENSLLGYSNPKYAMIEQCYKDIVFKYKDIMQLSEEALKAMLYEAGFSDILDALELSLEQLQMFVLYLPLFKALKGTDIGFNQVLSLLSHSYTLKTSITNPTELDNYTYELELITFLNVGFKANIASKLAKFSRSYV